MTNAMGQLPLNALTPAADPTKCTGAFTGSGGTPQCGLILAITPMDNPLVASKNYTGIALGCVVACGSGNTCPSSMTCLGTAPTGLCTPN